MKTEKITPTPIYIVGGQRENMQKRINGQMSNFLAINKLVRGFTLIEILTVITIIAIMLGILLPALNQVKKIAANAKQKAQNSSIEIGLTLYRNDFGEYPPSHGWDPSLAPGDTNDYKYSGAQTLTEAMFGYDLLGVHPDTVYRADGYDISGNSNRLLYPVPSASEPNTTNIGKRKGPYLDRANIGVYEPNQIFSDTATSLNKKGHMICDVFSFKSEKIGNKRCKIGTPILYFRANLSPVNMQSISDSSWPPIPHTENVYNYFDNYFVIVAGRVNEKEHKLYESPADGSNFYDFIRDPMIPISGTDSCGRPVRPDSFLLISAGYDGLYGTSDDICNFEPNIE